MWEIVCACVYLLLLVGLWLQISHGHHLNISSEKLLSQFKKKKNPWPGQSVVNFMWYIVCWGLLCISSYGFDKECQRVCLNKALAEIWKSRGGLGSTSITVFLLCALCRMCISISNSNIFAAVYLTTNTGAFQCELPLKYVKVQARGQGGCERGGCGMASLALRMSLGIIIL